MRGGGLRHIGLIHSLSDTFKVSKGNLGHLSTVGDGVKCVDRAISGLCVPISGCSPVGRTSARIAGMCQPVTMCHNGTTAVDSVKRVDTSPVHAGHTSRPRCSHGTSTTLTRMHERGHLLCAGVKRAWTAPEDPGRHETLIVQ